MACSRDIGLFERRLSVETVGNDSSHPVQLPTSPRQDGPGWCWLRDGNGNEWP
jgi:hypothetical protein